MKQIIHAYDVTGDLQSVAGSKIPLERLQSQLRRAQTAASPASCKRWLGCVEQTN